MSVRYYDISIPLRVGMTVWPGDAAFELLPRTRINEGENCNTSWMGLSTHTGTHIDAPWHFEENGNRLEQIDTALFFGEAMLVELLDVDVIRAADLGPERLPVRVLFKTRNSQYPVEAPFRRDFVALAADAARRLVDDGVKLVGIDYLSVAPPQQPGQETHHILLSNNVVVVEGLCLNGFSTSCYEFVVLPLALLGADGSPCRAFLGMTEDKV